MYSRRVLELFKELGGDGEVVATGELGDLTSVSERSTHDNRLVTVLLVVVEDLLDRLDSWVGLGGVLLTSGLLVPVEDLWISNSGMSSSGSLTRPTKGEIKVTPASAQATA